MVRSMSKPKQTRNLVKDLIGHLSGAVTGTRDRSLGFVGPGVSPPHPPVHCLRTCLHDDPGQTEARGCPWLRAAAAGRLDAACLKKGRCPRGFRVAGQPIRLNGSPGFLLAIEGASSRRSAADSPHQVLDKLELLSHILEQVGQVLDENEGLADEVLRSYEQLNLIFDFTQQIATLTDTDAIERALLSRLGESLAARTVLAVEPNGDYRCYDVLCGEWVSSGDASVLTEQLTAEIEAVRRSRALSVISTDTARIALGPMTRLDDKVEVVFAVRALDAGEFTAGDMLMIESILSFGGQIISNTEIHERLRRMSFESTRALVAAIDKKDHYTSGHSERVGFLAKLTGRRMGITPNELRILEMSGLLHDVGKIGIPEGILCKTGKLTKQEYDIIKKHPRMGYEILKPIASFGSILDGVLHHHENPDGSGYPDGLSREEIPLFARIIHVVDVFDALTSTRSYRVAFSIEQAYDILRKEAGTKLDAEVAAVFLELLPAFRAEHPEEFAALFSSEREMADATA